MALAILLGGCDQRPPSSSAVALAPPGPEDLGPATGLSEVPADAVVFDLKYRAQRGAPDDFSYYSFWGYGGSIEGPKANSFLQDVRAKSSRLYYVHNPSLKDREWAAIEHSRRTVHALYFDLDGDGRLGENERLPVTSTSEDECEIITPDFVNTSENGSNSLCRVLLQVRFFVGNEPNCIWSPAALLEGAATLGGKPAKLLLYASRPGGAFDEFGSSSYGLLFGEQTEASPPEYVPRERLSTLVSLEGHFYRLMFDGRRTNGLPARVLLVKDCSPTGSLAFNLPGTNALKASLRNVYLHGFKDKSVFIRVENAGEKVVLPSGDYVLYSGTASYGISSSDEWQMAFSSGLCATVSSNQVCEVALGQPSLKVRAVSESNRYSPQAPESATFKRGTRIYLEPRILGNQQEVFSRFQQRGSGNRREQDRPPEIVITGPDGKQLLSQSMEYG